MKILIKGIVLFLVSIGLGLTTLSAHAAGPNLIQNPSFETAGSGGDPANWLRGGWGNNTRVFTYPAAGQDGPKGARVEITSYAGGDAKWYFQEVPVTPGETYEFSDYYMSNVSSYAGAQFRMTDGSFTYLFSSQNREASPTVWTNASDTYVIPANVVAMTVFHVIEKVGYLTVDNYFLGQQTPPPPPPPSGNLIVNGSFENAIGANPEGWTADSWGLHSTSFTYPAAGRVGGKAATVQITSYPYDTGTGDSRWKHAEVPVTPGVQYTYSNWYKSTVISDVIGRYTNADGSYHYFGVIKEIPATPDWTYQSRTFTAPVTAMSVTILHLLSSAGSLTLDDVSLEATGNGIPDETEAPVVTWTNPVAGATVSGVVNLTVDATDNVGVTGLWFAVDGVPYGPTLTSAPWTMAWDTAAEGNGQHTLKATALDAIGNNVAVSISVTVDHSLTPPPTSGNLIANPSFETAGAGGNPASWNRAGWGTNTRSYTYPTVGADGNKAAKVTISSYSNGDAKWYFGLVPVTGGRTYAFNDAYKSTVPTELSVEYQTASGTQYQYLATLPTAAAWTNLSRLITVPANATAISVYHSVYGVGSLETDAYSLIAQ